MEQNEAQAATIERLTGASENAREEMLEVGFHVDSDAIAKIDAALGKQGPK